MVLYDCTQPKIRHFIENPDTKPGFSFELTGRFFNILQKIRA